MALFASKSPFFHFFPIVRAVENCLNALSTILSAKNFISFSIKVVFLDKANQQIESGLRMSLLFFDL